VYPGDGPVVVLPPGGGGRPPGGRPPGGLPPGGPPPRGPGFGPAAAGAAAVFGAPALISAARAGTDRQQDLPGLPPANERRYVPDEVIFVMNANAPANAVRNVVRRYNLTLIAEEQSQLVGAVLHRYRIPSRTTVPAAIRAITRSPGVGYVQPNYLFDRPNYVFRLQSASTTQGGGASMQYVVDQLRLPEAHRLARGEQVPIAVIDSGVEATHPEMAGRIAKSFDAIGGAFQPHEHGTGMAGAIVAHAQLTGVSPRASILAARAFAPGQSTGSSGTSFHILKAMDWSIREGARVINMSFAGPRDPLMTRAIQVAAGQRIAMVAAMGNEGPGAPVSFPAADPNVIAVTATDQAGRLFSAASRGNHVAVAAPGVEIILPAPRGGYQISSGTSVAAAHVSGIAALLLERQPDLDPAQLRQILQETARRGATADPLLGAGLADPVPALTAARAPDPSVPMVTAPPPAPPAATAEAPPAAGTGTATAEAPPPAPPRQATVDPGKAEAKD
jgi:subtilisin family serine protease